ncbi:sugar ABC transporter substrate-binding protein [Spirochaetia bacterium]|nr:sugar ABC transporter substrate-binding protein [Spirochaetia bacterium]
MKKFLVVMMLCALAASAFAGGGQAADASGAKPFEFTLYGNLVQELTEADQVFFKTLNERTNTNIKVQLPPSSSYAEALTIMMASGDYPDLVLFPSHTDRAFLDGVRDGVILPLNDYIAKAPNLQKYSYDLSWNTLKVLGDDKIYGIPRTSIARADGYFIRQDWLDKVGIAIEEGKPITLDKFTEILTAFTTKDPDGNGVNDTYGLGLTSGGGNLYINDVIGWAFGLRGWDEYPGEDYKYMDLRYSKKNPAMKNTLSYMNMLYKNRLIDPDWATLNSDAQTQRFDQGITGVRPGFVGWLPDYETTSKKATPNAKLSYIVGLVQKEGDKVQGGSYSTGFSGQWAIMKSAKDPQKIVDVLDYMLSDNFWETVTYGIEGSAWQYDANRNRIAIPGSVYNAGRQILRRNNAPEFFVGLSTAVADRSRVVNLLNTCIGQAVFSKDGGFRPAVADDPKFIDAGKAFDLAISKIIAGDLPVSAYDAELEKWYNAGGELYIRQMNAGIQAAN